MNSIQVFIVDDHYMVIEGISVLLKDQQDIELTGHASNAVSCLAYLKNKLPDVILMDMAMPGMDGPTATRLIRQNFPRAQIIALTSFKEPVSRLRGAG